VPTDTGQWEIYAFSTAEGRHSALDAEAGFDLNYGPTSDVQLTATLPLSFSHDQDKGWRGGIGDVELGVKYRFLNDKKNGISVAIFPRAILPTSTSAGDRRVRVLLPLWIGKDFASGTSVFAGGGYEINPGPENRDFWQAAAAVTHDVNDRWSVGAELARQGSNTVGGTTQTSAAVGSVVKLSDHNSFLIAGGPTWSDHRLGYHLYGALGLFF
jgi:hypothetical protein